MRSLSPATPMTCTVGQQKPSWSYQTTTKSVRVEKLISNLSKSRASSQMLSKEIETVVNIRFVDECFWDIIGYYKNDVTPTDLI